MAFHSRGGWRLKALVPPMFSHKPLRERQGSSRQQNGLPAFGCAPDNAVGAAAARATFSGAVHQPSGIPGVAVLFQVKADFCSRGCIAEKIDIYFSQPASSRSE